MKKSAAAFLLKLIKKKWVYHSLVVVDVIIKYIVNKFLFILKRTFIIYHKGSYMCYYNT